MYVYAYVYKMYNIYITFGSKLNLMLVKVNSHCGTIHNFIEKIDKANIGVCVCVCIHYTSYIFILLLKYSSTGFEKSKKKKFE